MSITNHLASEKGVVSINARERILTIRLLEKARAYPEFAEKLGISLTKDAGDVTKGKE